MIDYWFTWVWYRTHQWNSNRVSTRPVTSVFHRVSRVHRVVCDWVAFHPVVLGEELVEDAVAIGWKHLTCNPSHGLVAGRNKTCDVGFCMMSCGDDSDSNSSSTCVQDKKSVIDIVCPYGGLRLLPTSMCKAEWLVCFNQYVRISLLICVNKITNLNWRIRLNANIYIIQLTQMASKFELVRQPCLCFFLIVISTSPTSALHSAQVSCWEETS